MSIVVSKPLCFKKLPNSLVLAFFSLVLYLLLSLIPLITPTAKADCYAVNQNSKCSSIGKEYFLLTNSSQKCNTYLPPDTMCCCTIGHIALTKPKYLLISSVVAFFAILTTLVFFYKKNE